MRRITALAVVWTLMLGLCGGAGAFSYPSAYWPLQSAWDRVQQEQNVEETLSVAQKTYDLFQDYPLGKEVCQILEPVCNLAAWCCELKGDLNGAIVWRERQLTYAQWLNDNFASYRDTLLNVNAQLHQLRRPVEVYALAQKPADVPYYEAIGEPVSGVYYGTTPESQKTDGSAALMYVHFQDGYSMQYWLDYYRNGSEACRRALSQGGVVELAWNLQESDAGVAAVLAADSYIEESMAALGALPCTVLLRFGAEMNCWADLPSPEQYIQAFQKVAQYARKYSNIAMVFSPNDIGNRTVDYEDYYPGDAVVDWIGVSTYKTGVGGSSSYTYSNTGYSNDAFYCKGIYGNDPLTVLQDLSQLAAAHKKPMMISECGFSYQTAGVEQTGYAVSQLNKFYAYLPMVYPQIKAIFFFDKDIEGGENRYALSGSAALSSAYDKAVAANGALLRAGQTAGAGYTRLSTLSEQRDTLSLATYAIFPGSGAAECRYYVDGTLKQTAGEEPFAYELKVSELAPGRHTIRVEAACGAFSRTVEQVIYVDDQGFVMGADAADLQLSSAAAWATGAIMNARARGLVTSRTGSGFDAPITRLQFAELAVNLIENVTGREVAAGGGAFHDTSDPVAQKAVAAGIASGTGGGNFSPDAPITREQICVMLHKVIQYVDQARGSSTLPAVATTLDGRFADAGQVDAWAVESMALLTNSGLMSGTGPDTLSPQKNTSVQEAVTLILALHGRF